MKNKTYTVEQAAKLLQKNIQVVTRACKKLKVKKFGASYIIEETDLKLLKTEISEPGVKKKDKKY